MMEGKVNVAGTLGTRLIPPPARDCSMLWKIKNFPNIARAWRIPLARALGIPTYHGTLKAKLINLDGSVVNYGVIGYRQITTAFVDFVVDQLQTETAIFGDFKFHDSGVGVTAENITDTDIETTDAESRATGTQVEGASSNIYRSVGTIAYTTTKAITEHGLFNASTGVTLMDRTVFTVINVVNGNSIEFTYEITLTAGS